MTSSLSVATLFRACTFYSVNKPELHRYQLEDLFGRPDFESRHTSYSVLIHRSRGAIFIWASYSLTYHVYTTPVRSIVGCLYSTTANWRTGFEPACSHRDYVVCYTYTLRSYLSIHAAVIV